MSELGKKEMIDALFDHATEGILIADAHGKILLINPSAEKMFGFLSNELYGESIEILIPDQLKRQHKINRESYSVKPNARPMGLGLDLKAKRKDGSLFPVEISLSPLKKDNEQLFIAFIIDISIRKQIEESVKEKQKELEKVAAVLIATNEELEKKVSDRTQVLQEAILELENSRNELTYALEKEKDLNDLKSRFISMASHEFRTPLTTILSSASLINEYNKPEQEEKKIKHVNRIKSAVNNLNDILSDFLSISKMEEGKILPEYKLFDLFELADEVMNDMQITAKIGQKIIHTHEGSLEVYLDNKLIRNILINIISNAIKFTDENKSILLKTFVTKENALIEIEDHGIGISEEDQKHLFERFFRGGNALNINGTGLGLHIVGNFVDLLKGHITLSSKLNIGTIIKINFPLSKEQS